MLAIAFTLLVLVIIIAVLIIVLLVSLIIVFAIAVRFTYVKYDNTYNKQNDRNSPTTHNISLLNS